MYSITMNDETLDYLSFEEILEALNWHVKYLVADLTVRNLGPVVEYDYYMHFESDWYNFKIAEGLHRVTIRNNQPIAYQGPGEEG